MSRLELHNVVVDVRAIAVVVVSRWRGYVMAGGHD
jgi:hypothetical protein